MSWWDDGDDVLGDGPADMLKEAWRGVLTSRAERNQPQPGFEEALNAYASALQATDLRPSFSRIVAWKGAEPMKEFDGRAADAELASAFRPALDLIGQKYLQRFDRPPTPSELVKTLEFILMYRPEDYLRDASTIDWSDVRLRSG